MLSLTLSIPILYSTIITTMKMLRLYTAPREHTSIFCYASLIHVCQTWKWKFSLSLIGSTALL